MGRIRAYADVTDGTKGAAKPRDGGDSNGPNRSKRSKHPSGSSASGGPSGPGGFRLPPGSGWHERGPPPPRFLAAGASLTTSVHVDVEVKPHLDEVAALLRLLSGRRSSQPAAVAALVAFARSRGDDFVRFVEAWSAPPRR